MKSNSIITRSLFQKTSVWKLGFKRKKKFTYQPYGTSSKSADNNLNSKFSWFSIIKNTSDNVLPAFWKYVKVSSSVVNQAFSSIKNTVSADQKYNASKSDEFQNIKSEDSSIVYAGKNSSTPTVVPPTLPKKEEENNSNVLEEAFIDWLAVGDNHEKRKEFLEKNDKQVNKIKKSLISRSSLQQRSRFLVHSLKEAVSPGSQLLRLEEVCKHLLLYPNQKTEMCKAGLLKTALSLKCWSNDNAVQSQAQNTLALIGYHQPPGGQGVRILSIDGGGTRGIMSIEVLRQLEAKTNKKVYELFDYICGVSSGAILSLLLGGLRLSLDECESLYRRLSDEVFNQSSFWGTGRLMWNHAYYETTTWVNVLKKTFGEKLLIETSKSSTSPKIAAISAIMNLPHLQPFIFRNYDFAPQVQSYYLGSCRYRMWEAIRASGAAPGYFEEYCLDDYLHQDGGIMVNNPTALGIHEARLLWPSESIQCVLSLGSGRYIPASQPNYTSTSLKTKVLKVIDSATDTEGVHVILNDLLSPYTYFRINPYLTEFLPLDENRVEKLDQMKSDAQMYLRRNEYKLSNCAMTLCLPRSYLKTSKDWLITQKHLYL